MTIDWPYPRPAMPDRPAWAAPNSFQVDHADGSVTWSSEPIDVNGIDLQLCRSSSPAGDSWVQDGPPMVHMDGYVLKLDVAERLSRTLSDLVEQGRD